MGSGNLKRLKRKVIVEKDLDQKIRNLQAQMISSNEKQVSFSEIVNQLVRKAFERGADEMIPKKETWDTRDVPILLLCVIMTGGFLWAMYGIQNSNLAISILNSAVMGIGLDLILKKLRFFSKNKTWTLKQKISFMWVNPSLG